MKKVLFWIGLISCVTSWFNHEVAIYSLVILCTSIILNETEEHGKNIDKTDKRDICVYVSSKKDVRRINYLLNHYKQNIAFSEISKSEYDFLNYVRFVEELGFWDIGAKHGLQVISMDELESILSKNK